MPSDLRTADAARLLRRDLERFETAVAVTAEDVRRVLERLASSAEDRTTLLTARLGRFGANYMDTQRFAALVGDHEPASRVTTELVEAALPPLDELAQAAGDMAVVEVGAGEMVYEAVASTLASLGRAFGAARLVRATKTGQYRPNDHARSLGSFPFSKWNASERGIAPPIVVEVAGEQMRVGALSEFLDGRLKIVLVVHGDCPPAPLVRLVSPGVFVVQAREVAELEPFAAWTGPGIAALVPDECARFAHDPRGGPQTWDRITIAGIPADRPRKAVAGLSAAQQREEIALLSMLAAAPALTAPAVETPAPAGTPGAEPRPADPADKLAAWLLEQADLSGLE